MRRRPLASVVVVAVALPLLGAPVAHAQDAQLARLVSAKSSLKWNWVPPGKSARYGHSEVLIEAPLPKVRGFVVDYGRYRLFSTKFKAVRVVAKQGETTDVYFRIPILKGMSTMSYVLRFGPPKVVAPGVEVLESRFVSGSSNVKDVQLSFTMREVEGHKTILSVDLLAVPSFPAPQDAIDEELRDAAMNAVDAVHTQAVAAVNPAPPTVNAPPPAAPPQ
jgi:hypothetical protein